MLVILEQVNCAHAYVAALEQIDNIKDREKIGLSSFTSLLYFTMCRLTNFGSGVWGQKYLFGVDISSIEINTEESNEITTLKKLNEQVINN